MSRALGSGFYQIIKMLPKSKLYQHYTENRLLPSQGLLQSIQSDSALDRSSLLNMVHCFSSFIGNPFSLYPKHLSS